MMERLFLILLLISERLKAKVIKEWQKQEELLVANIRLNRSDFISYSKRKSQKILGVLEFKLCRMTGLLKYFKMNCKWTAKGKCGEEIGVCERDREREKTFHFRTSIWMKCDWKETTPHVCAVLELSLNAITSSAACDQHAGGHVTKTFKIISKGKNL